MKLNETFTFIGQITVQKVVFEMQFSCVYTVISDVELNNCYNYK